MKDSKHGNDRTAMMVVIQFDHRLHAHFTAGQWHEFLRKLIHRGMIPITWSKGKRPPPIGVAFDFGGSETPSLPAGFDLGLFEGSDEEGAACQFVPDHGSDEQEMPEVPAETVIPARVTITEVPW